MGARGCRTAQCLWSRSSRLQHCLDPRRPARSLASLGLSLGFQRVRSFTACMRSHTRLALYQRGGRPVAGLEASLRCGGLQHKADIIAVPAKSDVKTGGWAGRRVGRCCTAGGEGSGQRAELCCRRCRRCCCCCCCCRCCRCCCCCRCCRCCCCRCCRQRVAGGCLPLSPPLSLHPHPCTTAPPCCRPVGINHVSGPLLDLSACAGTLSVDAAKNATVYGPGACARLLDACDGPGVTACC